MSIEKCKLISLPKISDDRGSLSVVENYNNIPFNIRRIFYMYDMTQSRGDHAHEITEQFIIPISGNFWVKISDGYKSKEFFMNRRYVGLYVCTKIWVEIFNIDINSICLVLASNLYNKDDYIRDYDEFLQIVRSNK